MNANIDLATPARAIAAKAPGGSMKRRAWGCVAVALSTTHTIGAARKVLADVRDADVQAAALDVLAQLAAEMIREPI
jgi:hypothetical protein